MADYFTHTGFAVCKNRPYIVKIILILSGNALIMILGGAPSSFPRRESRFSQVRALIVQKNKREQNSGNAGALFGGGN
jgi:hypothetical protein